MRFFKAIKLLLPKSKIFNLTQNTSLRKFFSALSVLPEDVKKETESVYLDFWPETTRAIEEWENQFGISISDEKYNENRAGILRALWMVSLGGQSLPYIQSILKNLYSEINIYENVPVKNPRDSNAVYACMCGQRSSVCGNKKLNCGYKEGDEGFVPNVIRNNSEGVYDIPVNTQYWENYFYVGKDLVRNDKGEIVYCEKLIVDSKWKPFIEYVILKTKPVHMGALMFVEYKDNYDSSRRIRRNVKIR